MNAVLRAICPLLIIGIASIAVAQDGVSSAGMSRTRYMGELGIIPSPDEVVVEDIVNYHRHDIGRPKAGEAVHMDVRWGNDVVDREAILEVGLSTALTRDKQKLRPINLSLVIDKSGSMSGANKMNRVKQAVAKLVMQLRPIDTLSIVVFDSTAQVLMEPRKVDNLGQIQGIISSIQPGSSTNIEAGLKLGYEEALKGYRKGITNRVVLLTDGIANVGITDPAKIASESLGYNDRGVDLSTIGLGIDLNKDLLRTLAKSGRGLFHFVAEDEDINKVFLNEVQSLLSPVASDPSLELTFGPGLVVAQMFGYEPKMTGSSMTVPLDTMNSGMTQVVLMRLSSTLGEGGKIPVTAKLSYFDIERQKQITTTERTFLTIKPGTKSDLLDDNEVAKNHTVAMLGQAIHDMAVAVAANDYRKAQTKLDTAIAATRKRYPNLQDADIKRVLDNALRYQQVLRKQNGGSEDGIESPGPNLIQNGDFSQGNIGFASDLDYVHPGENGLWGAYYTVAPRFNQPQLHTLIAASPFESPEKVTGREKVLFANAGPPGALTMWAATVKCQPNTRYVISFQAISLTPGPEWVPNYQIYVGEARSTVQLAGQGAYSRIVMVWNSGKSKVANISIVKMESTHRAGIVGIAAVKMVASNEEPIYGVGG